MYNFVGLYGYLQAWVYPFSINNEGVSSDLSRPYVSVNLSFVGGGCTRANLLNQRGQRTPKTMKKGIFGPHDFQLAGIGKKRKSML
jgi:hypothetical protein